MKYIYKYIKLADQGSLNSPLSLFRLSFSLSPTAFSVLFLYIFFFAFSVFFLYIFILAHHIFLSFNWHAIYLLYICIYFLY